jgi:hypothetical protein
VKVAGRSPNSRSSPLMWTFMMRFERLAYECGYETGL